MSATIARCNTRDQKMIKIMDIKNFDKTDKSYIIVFEETENHTIGKEEVQEFMGPFKDLNGAKSDEKVESIDLFWAGDGPIEGPIVQIKQIKKPSISETGEYETNDLFKTYINLNGSNPIYITSISTTEDQNKDNDKKLMFALLNHTAFPQGIEEIYFLSQDDEVLSAWQDTMQEFPIYTMIETELASQKASTVDFMNDDGILPNHKKCMERKNQLISDLCESLPNLLVEDNNKRLRLALQFNDLCNAAATLDQTSVEADKVFAQHPFMSVTKDGQETIKSIKDFIKNKKNSTNFRNTFSGNTKLLSVYERLLNENDKSIKGYKDVLTTLQRIVGAVPRSRGLEST